MVVEAFVLDGDDGVADELGFSSRRRALVRFWGATSVVMRVPSRATTTDDSAVSGMVISKERVSYE
jgi:hypothetical protein